MASTSAPNCESRGKFARITAQKELETSRQFFGFCRDRRWIADNPASRIKTPKNIKPAEVVPYEPAELARIIAACDDIGRGAYERQRARAMVLLFQRTALRISDVATLVRTLEAGMARQGRITSLMRALESGTYTAREEKRPVVY